MYRYRYIWGLLLIFLQRIQINFNFKQFGLSKPMLIESSPFLRSGCRCVLCNFGGWRATRAARLGVQDSVAPAWPGGLPRWAEGSMAMWSSGRSSLLVSLWLGALLGCQRGPQGCVPPELWPPVPVSPRYSRSCPLAGEDLTVWSERATSCGGTENCSLLLSGIGFFG